MAKFYIKEGTAQKWKSLEWEKEVEFSGKITKIFSINMADKNNIRKPFLWIEIRDCVPLLN